MKHLVIYAPEGAGKTSKALELAGPHPYVTGPDIFNNPWKMGRALLSGRTIIVEEPRVLGLAKSAEMCSGDLMEIHRKYLPTLKCQTPRFIFVTASMVVANFVTLDPAFTLLDLTK